MDLTKHIGLWVHEPTSALGHLHEIKALGFTYLLVKLADGRSAFQPNATRALLAAAASMSLPVVPWVYAYPGESGAVARAVEALLPAGCADLVVDMEKEFETGPSGAAEAEALLHAVAVATGHRVALHLSSFWSPLLHSQFPFAAALRHCASWMPQSYYEGGSRTPAEILSGSLAEAASVTLPSQPVIPTVNGTAFVPLLKAKGITGWSAYCWDNDGDAKVSVSQAAWEQALAQF